ncbi:IS1096 element passenger TnpR family protein [Croceivirga lutea]|uniref:IS1096 element passenger TnpR family protein n=1 Tax=Croceivirga lutea TaxID=1775167 RepID=UPI00163AB3D6|nr:hypothetical protein [Croceivirga lutea]
MIYRIRIILDAEEDIFRDMEIEEDSTLEDFHNTITQSFGFAGNEMASFYTCDEEWNQEEEIALFEMNDAGDARLMSNTLLNEVMTEKNPKMIYLYDFLSMWTFFVELADITEKEDGKGYPNLLFSFGELPDSPPEKSFESDPNLSVDLDLDDNDIGNYDDLDFDENWN